MEMDGIIDNQNVAMWNFLAIAGLLAHPKVPGSMCGRCVVRGT